MPTTRRNIMTLPTSAASGNDSPGSACLPRNRIGYIGRAARRRRVLLAGLPLLTALLMHGQASATCKSFYPEAQPFYFVFADTAIRVPRDAPIGAVLAKGVSVGSTTVGIDCIPAGDYIRRLSLVSGSSVGGRNGVYSLGATGIGFRLIQNRSRQPMLEGVSVVTTTRPYGRERFGSIKLNNEEFSLELVKTGNAIKEPHVAAHDLMQLDIAGHDLVRFRLGHPLTFPATTCNSAVGKDRMVNMGKVLVADFGGVGTAPYARAPVSFRLSMDCTGHSGMVRAIFTDSVAPSNTGDVLSLGSGSSADGVGIQIFYNGQAVHFSPDTGLFEQNRMNLFQSDGAQHSFHTVQFWARYIQTKPVIQAGSVRARATVSFFYE